MLAKLSARLLLKEEESAPEAKLWVNGDDGISKSNPEWAGCWLAKLLAATEPEPEPEPEPAARMTKSDDIEQNGRLTSAC